MAQERDANQRGNRLDEVHRLRGQLIRAAVRKGTLAGKIFPVFAGSALRNRGVQPAMDGIVLYLPSPEEAPPARGSSRVGISAMGQPRSMARSVIWYSMGNRVAVVARSSRSDRAIARVIDSGQFILGPDVADQVGGRIRVPVHVAVEARDAGARLQGPPVLRGVELLLGERRDQQADAFQLLRI